MVTSRWRYRARCRCWWRPRSWSSSSLLPVSCAVFLVTSRSRCRARRCRWRPTSWLGFLPSLNRIAGEAGRAYFQVALSRAVVSMASQVMACLLRGYRGAPADHRSALQRLARTFGCDRVNGLQLRGSVPGHRDPPWRKRPLLPHSGNAEKMFDRAFPHFLSVIADC